MSLRAWWPLIETIDNKIHGIEMTNASPVFNNNGKLGKCLEVNTTTHLNIPTSIYNIHTVDDTELSYSLWIKIDKAYLNQLITTLDFSTKTKIYNKIIGLAGTSTSSGLGIHIRTDDLTSSSQLDQVYIYSALRTNNNSNTGTVTLINLDQWYHVAVTYDKLNKFKFYINGELVYSKTVTQRTTTATDINTRSVIIDGPYSQLSSGDQGNVHQLSLKEYYNDIRVYDHALSAMEVHQLAQGLILHYKLDEMPNKNLLLAPNTVGNWTTQYCTITKETDWLKVTISQPQNCEFYQNVTNVWTPSGLAYTVSFDARASVNNLQITLGRTSSSIDNITFNLTTEWKHYSGTFTNTISTSGGALHVAIYNGAAGNILRIKDIKLEYGEIATNFSSPIIIIDNSGYEHYGTVTGALESDRKNIRYKSSTYCNNGGSNYIQTPTLNMPIDAITLNIWFKTTNITPTSDYHMIVDSVGNSSQRQHYEMCVYKTGIFRGGLFVNGSRQVDNCTSTTACNGQWHMLTLLYDGTAVKRYYDGVMEKSTSVTITSGLQPTATLRLFKDGYSSYACIEASLSDFRIYTTALSQEDIINLYKTTMFVDNIGNISTYELVEQPNPMAITKQGQLISNDFIESGYEFPLNVSTKTANYIGATHRLNIVHIYCFIPLNTYGINLHLHYKVQWSNITKYDNNSAITAKVTLSYMNATETTGMRTNYEFNFSSIIEANPNGSQTVDDDMLTFYSTSYEWDKLSLDGEIVNVNSNGSFTISDVKITANISQAAINPNVIFANEFIEG